jgi:pimeloyl-ACP methyl ester carboxylesterase
MRGRAAAGPSAPRLARTTVHPRGVATGPTVIFVHGAWHGAWCWAEHFLPYFADHGHPAHAVDLRGHGESEGRQRLRRTSLSEYVDDLGRVVRDVSRREDPRVVLVGHSMGGVVVQKYLERHEVAAAVLMATVPPRSALPAALRLAARHPLAFLRASATLSLYPLVASAELARGAFYSRDIPPERLRMYVMRLQDESYRAFVDMLGLNRPRHRRVRTPTLVLGADHDTFFTRGEVEATARAYGTEAVFFPMAHNMMLEDGWPTVADHILGWLRDRG